MENKLRYQVRCSVCGVLDGRRYVDMYGRRYWCQDGAATPPDLLGCVVKSVWMLFPRGQKPICSECHQEQLKESRSAQEK